MRIFHQNEAGKSGLWRRVIHALSKNPLAIFGLTLILVVVFSAIFAPWIAPHNPFDVNLKEQLLPPGGKYLLGTDDMGRDVLSRCLFGFRISLRAAVIVILVACTVGVILGVY